MKPGLLRQLTLFMLFALLGGLQYRLWGSDGGLIDSRRLKAAVDVREADNAGLRKRNAELEAEVADLRAGGPAIEAHARRTLGMVHKGETFYLVVEPATQ